jgi:hypothetical protein
MPNAFEKFGITNLSPSSCNLFATSPWMWCLEKLFKIRSPVGSAAHRGSAVEAGVDHGLFNLEASLEECQAVAVKRYNELTALMKDNSREKNLDAIPGYVAQGLAELRPYGTPSHSQQRMEVRLEGVSVPFVGYLDYYWEHHGILTDLKTQAALQSEISTPHARQVSMYGPAISNNLDLRLTYVTPKKAATYRLENAHLHVQALANIGRTIERFLSVSDSADELIRMLVPDVEHFYISSNPIARQKAFEIAGV